ncbi:MAG: nuclear transport factor 2 family protein [Desulfarculus sp.]|nr:nuclear transport factor 2 family protein [Desulfarculus sp.]
MLFYVQMKWNYQGRISQDQLWDLELLEGEHGLEGLNSGLVKGLYKVVSQHRVIAIVEVATLEDLDRNSMGWLPMREYLEFEQVWALRDYPGFIEDVRNKFPIPPPPPVPSTREVAQQWFSLMGAGKSDEALKYVDDDVIWVNIPPTAGVSDLAPWLGSYRGLPAVLKSFDVWAAHSQMISFTPLSLIVEGENAVAVVHEHAKCLANGNEYDLYVSTHLRINGGKIKEWRVYWDISPLIKAYRNL